MYLSSREGGGSWQLFIYAMFTVVDNIMGDQGLKSEKGACIALGHPTEWTTRIPTCACATPFSEPTLLDTDDFGPGIQATFYQHCSCLHNYRLMFTI